MEALVLRQMLPADAGEVCTVQRAAFVAEAQLYGDPHLPPLVETPAQIVADLESCGGFVAVLHGRLVGCVRVRVDGRQLHIGRLAVAPDLQGRGIGAALLALAETAASADEALLFTGHLSEGNLRLYGRAGYVEQRRVRVDDRVVLVHLRKPLPPGPSLPQVQIR
jgi:ribosomal protein S18 acetylase RimI-like enzyme